MSCNVKVILKSKNASTGDILTTVALRYWRPIHAELMTHRAFSRNAGSSRAIPVKTMLAQVWNDPAGPIHWGANQSGMQAGSELQGWRKKAAQFLWRTAGKAACVFAWTFMKVGLHKQVANRLLEPWQYINVLVSATDWDNFFNLRCHPDAQPEMQELACAIRDAIEDEPAMILTAGQWHLPYIDMEEAQTLSLQEQKEVSAARCARVSYAPFDGNAAIEKERSRYALLVGSKPIHASPTEHQAQALKKSVRMANFAGWMQLRTFIEAAAK